MTDTECWVCKRPEEEHTDEDFADNGCCIAIHKAPSQDPDPSGNSPQPACQTCERPLTAHPEGGCCKVRVRIGSAALIDSLIGQLAMRGFKYDVDFTALYSGSWVLVGVEVYSEEVRDLLKEQGVSTSAGYFVVPTLGG